MNAAYRIANATTGEYILDEDGYEMGYKESTRQKMIKQNKMDLKLWLENVCYDLNGQGATRQYKIVKIEA
jgi:hypothetical protein